MVSFLSGSYILKSKRPLEFGRWRRSLLFVMRIVFCARSVPKDVPRDHPGDLDHADNDGSQKIKSCNNNIQNFHSGTPPFDILQCKHSDRPEKNKQVNFPGHLCQEEADHLLMQGSTLTPLRLGWRFLVYHTFTEKTTAGRTPSFTLPSAAPAAAAVRRRGRPPGSG